MKIYFVVNARMPNEKAHGIHIAKMAEALIEAGSDVVLVVPTRRTTPSSVREFYNLRVAVPLVHTWAFDFYTYGRIGYRLSSYSFMLSSLAFLWMKRLSRERFVVYTVDLDDFSSSLLPLVGQPLYSEMHGGKPNTFPQRFLFRFLRGSIAINGLIVEELKKTFPHARVRYIVEPMGVDLSVFATRDKHDARKALGLPQDARIMLYAGRLIAWKGLEIIPSAAAQTPNIRWQMVGGDVEEFRALVTESLPANVFFAGSRPHVEMPLWLAAADALLVLGTQREMLSYRYTSPMKLFEYMPVGRNIVAAKTPAIEQVVSQDEVFFYTPDDAGDLARVTERAACAPDPKRVITLQEAAHKYTWAARASRIQTFLDQHE